MGKTYQGMSLFAVLSCLNNNCGLTRRHASTSTPAEVGGSLANKDRGIFHIQDAEYWEFYDLEFINGPYGVYARDASNNHYERIITRENYETGTKQHLTSTFARA